nr:hypothetical protein [uncultured Tolumonas sp.]
MSIKSRATQLESLLNNFFNLKPDEFFKSGPSYNDFDGPSVEESEKNYLFIYTTLKPLLDSGQLVDLTWSAISSIQQNAQNAYNTYNQLISNRDQGAFQNFSTNLDGFANILRMYNIPYLVLGGYNLESTRALLVNELDTLQKNNIEVEQLKESVKTLITPAIAGSLSKSFTQRRNSIMFNRVIWLIIAITIGYFVIIETNEFVNHISNALSQTKPETSNIGLWPTIAIRTVVLIPLFAAFGFAFSQYRKERDFEEEYAHKAAVAASLPNYGDLAREQSVKDQIVTGATSVIFSSPSQDAKNNQNSDAVLSGIKEMIESVGKAFSKR